MATSESSHAGPPGVVEVLRADETLVRGLLFLGLGLPVALLWGTLPTLVVTVLAGGAAGGFLTVSLSGFARLYFDPVPAPGDFE